MNSYGYLLSSLFVNWLPQELHLIISREIGDAEWRIDEIMTIVELEISARERAFAFFSSETHGTVLLTAAVLLTNDHQSKCAYCRQSHSSLSCTTIIDVSQWKAILKRTGRCYVCLKRHHLSRDCCSAVKCACCNGRHHTSICKDSNSIQSSRNSGNSTHHSTHSQSNAAIGQGTSANIQQPANRQALQSPVSQSSMTGSPTSTTTTELYCVNANTPVLLQTAQVYIHKPYHPTCGTTIRIMLDGWSQRSYMTQRVKDILELQSE